MRKIFWGLIFTAFAVSCNNKGKEAQAEQKELDSLARVEVDTTDLVQEEEEAPMPKAADELFDDFIFNFIKNKRLQKERVKFPLSHSVDGKKSQISKSEWSHDKLFGGHEFYTVIYDKESQAALEKDTAVGAVSVQWIELDKGRIKKYNFLRNSGQWRLMAITENDVTEHDNKDFLEFYQKFVTDAEYERAHVNSPLEFVTTDPDDEFSTIEGTLDVDQWFAFKPQMPSGMITNINYGQKNSDHNHKVLMVKGVSNSMQMTFRFRKVDGEWMLVAFEN